jgi:hypothetical protein
MINVSNLRRRRAWLAARTVCDSSLWLLPTIVHEALKDQVASALIGGT